jgi:hypothetical protein
MAYTTINKGSSYFNSVLYTGNATTNAITGVGFQPDFVWCKNRPSVLYHGLYDAVRGTGTTKGLSSNSYEAEGANALYINLTSFNSDGFTLGATVNTNQINKSGENHVSWNWLGANTTVSNTSGSITSTVSANTTSGFSIVSYTGTGANATIGHGLGVAPKMIILKNRTNGAADWRVYHASVGNTVFLKLNTTGATVTASTAWNNTTPTSSVFSVGTSADVNENTATFIAYCFADVKGFSKFGSYTGNGSSDGPMIYTGFKPAFILRKRTDSTGDWYIEDNKRNTYNPVDLILEPNLTSAEGTASSMSVDFLSNGFKIRGTSLDGNASGGTYIYAAFAENPFVLTDGTPVTAR